MTFVPSVFTGIIHIKLQIGVYLYVLSVPPPALHAVFLVVVSRSQMIGTI